LYICPAGNEMKLWNWFKEGKTGTNFKLYGTMQCPSCPFKPLCTSNRLGRIVKRSEHEEIIEMMREKLNTEEGLKRINKRKEIAEHPFGTMKRLFNQGYLLLKGLRKVTGEIGFTMLAYNLRRVINILGTSSLKAAVGNSI
jgi:hypothetical protein